MIARSPQPLAATMRQLAHVQASRCKPLPYHSTPNRALHIRAERGTRESAVTLMGWYDVLASGTGAVVEPARVLAAKMRCSIRTVQRCNAELEATGQIIRQTRHARIAGVVREVAARTLLVGAARRHAAATKAAKEARRKAAADALAEDQYRSARYDRSDVASTRTLEVQAAEHGSARSVGPPGDASRPLLDALRAQWAAERLAAAR